VKGDSVLVVQRTFYENIHFKGKEIIVKNSHGPTNTIIDGSNLASVIKFGSGTLKNSILDGFTITNGDAYSGGGISINDGATIINNNIFSNTGRYGSGVCCNQYSTANIFNKHIWNNTAQDDKGGIHSCEATVNIINNTLSYNDSKYGGGISCCYASKLIINNTFYGKITHLLVKNFVLDRHHALTFPSTTD